MEDENKFVVAIKGMKLSDEDSDHIKKLVEELVSTEIKKLNPSQTQGSAVSNEVIIANPQDPKGNGGRGTRVCIGTNFGRQVYWDSFTGFVMKDGDRITMKEEDAGIGANQIEIVLYTTYKVRWGKEIQVQYCFKRHTTIHTQDANHGPLSMTLDLNSVDALYFRKQKFAGVMTDVYYLYNVNEKAGKRITFTWEADG